MGWCEQLPTPATINLCPGLHIFICGYQISGVWFLHCHLERHFSWGMTTVLIVTDGPTAETSLLPPPTGMPNCSDRTLSMTRDQNNNQRTNDHLMLIDVDGKMSE